MTVTKISCILALSGTVALTGCETDQQNTVAGGAATGALLCGGLSALLGGDSGQTAAAAAACGVAGAAAGVAVARTKESYINTEDMISTEQELVAGRINQTRNYNANLRRQTAALNAEADRLAAATRSGADTRDAARAARDSSNAQLAAARDQARAVRSEIETTEQLYAEASSSGASAAELSTWRSRIDALNAEEGRLGSEINALVAAGDRF